MNVTAKRGGPKAGLLKARIAEIGDAATHLTVQTLGGRLPSLRIVITDTLGLVRTLQEADLRLAGNTQPGRWSQTLSEARHAHGVFGATTLLAEGALLLINGPRHRGNLREFDATLIHETAHAIQLTQPGAREQHITYLRQQFGLQPDSEDSRRAYERLIDIREHQARNLEALARRLPQPAGP